MAESIQTEDAKLVILARGAMARSGLSSAAAVRDLEGRSYVGVPVTMSALRLTGLQVAVATAMSSGATGFEAVALVGGSTQDDGLDAVRELSPTVAVVVTDRDGNPL